MDFQNHRFRKIALTVVVIFVGIMAVLGIVAAVMITSRDKSTENKKPEQPDERGELLLVQLLFRHGARTPYFSYPGDPYSSYSWPEGVGGLTVKGKDRMYHYGQLVRQRYEDYLESIQIKNIQAQSSPVRRCLESTVSVLGGLFPPVKSQIWSPTLDIAKQWQPIGVSTVEPSRAYLLGTPPCPAADEIEKQIPNLPSTKKLYSDNRDFLERFSKLSGLNATSNYQIVSYTSDSIDCYRNYFGDSFLRPDWIQQVGPDVWLKLREFLNFQFGVVGDLGTKYLRLRAGSFVKEMLNRLNATIAKGNITDSNREVYAYGTHDIVVSYILHAFGLFKEQPTFGSGLIFELRSEPITEIPNVYVYYSNGTANFDIQPLQLNQSVIFEPFCANIYCSYDNFTLSLQQYIPVDIELECGNNRKH